VRAQQVLDGELTVTLDETAPDAIGEPVLPAQA
jgi:hypothetical protein